MEHKIKTLKDMSGLEVTTRKEKNEDIFEFYLNNNCIKSCFTYPKAKLFAEGIKFGKSLKEI